MEARDAVARGFMRARSLSLASHSLLAAASSRAAADGRAAFRLTKYSPVAPSISGEDAR